MKNLASWVVAFTCLTTTRVQTPEGRIPTFWTHDTLGSPLYDWLNCMGSSAAALLELADATE